MSSSIIESTRSTMTGNVINMLCILYHQVKKVKKYDKKITFTLISCVIVCSLCVFPVTGDQINSLQGSQIKSIMRTNEYDDNSSRGNNTKDTIRTLVNKYKAGSPSKSSHIEPIDSNENASVILRWPETKKLQDQSMSTDLTSQESFIGSHFVASPVHYNHLANGYRRHYQPSLHPNHQLDPYLQDDEGGSSPNLRTVYPKPIAPYPPHRDYVDHDSVHPPEDIPAKEKDKETLKKYKKYLKFKPVDHDMFKTNGKNVATLPYAPTQPFTDLQYAIDSVRRAVLKVNPMKAKANQAFKSFNKEIKVILFVSFFLLLCF